MSQNLPNGWVQTTIVEVTVEAQQRQPKPNEEFLYIDISSIDRNTKQIRSPQHLNGENAPSRARKVVAAGDVLVSMTRPNLNAVAIVPREFDGQIASTGFDVLRAVELDSRWLFYLVRTDDFISAMSVLVQGALYPAVRSKDVRGFKMPLAPLNEQSRIADKLDSLLARVDACRERLERVPLIVTRFRQAVLTAAMSGKLTENWRADNHRRTSGKSIAKKLRAAHEAAGGHKIGNAAPPTEDVHNLTPEMFPAGWELMELRELVEPDRPITYGILKPGPDLDIGIPYVRVADFPNDQLNLANIRKTSPAIDKEFSRSRLKAGDILLSIRGTVGRLIVIPPELEGANITQDSARLSIQSHTSSKYVLWYLRSDLAQRRMKRAEKGVAVRGINIGDVRALQVAIPSLKEQHEIVRRVELLFAHADQLEARYKAARVYVEQLTPALLAKAFRGELVPQDPNDEPASVLLERIRAARTEEQSKPRTRPSKAPSKSKRIVEVIMLKRDNINQTHLSDILKARGPLTSEALWSASQLDIDDFYDQLKAEEASGLLKETRDESSDALRLLEAA